MQSIFELKEQSVTDAPLLLFECVLADGRTERWSTHDVTVGGLNYEARILQHNTFEIQTASDMGVDGIPRISVVLANADSRFSEIERTLGWKGAKLKVGFLFYDLRAGAPLSDIAILFQGVCNAPDDIQEGTLRLTASNRMNLQRLLLPQVRIQRRCPWDFPRTDAERLEAVDGGTAGKYSRFFKCGYSAGVDGGTGALNDGNPFTGCGYTRNECQARGMFNHFGGLEFVPPAISVRTFGDKSSHTSAIAVNGTRYNDFVPMVYGTAWYMPPVVFARNDGNLTRMEVLLGMGEMEGVLKVLVNDVEIPAGIDGTNMTASGWYNIRSRGTREGRCNADFTDGNGQSIGDPYGSMAYLSVVVPNRLNDGSSLPRVKVLVQGLRLPVYDADGNPSGERFSSNPAWVLLDILRRTGWSAAEIDISSFASAATYCDELIPALDIYGKAITIPRFQCNVVLQNRRSAGDLVRGVRNSARMLLTYGASGKLQLRVENTLALEQPAKPEWSNSTEPLDGGWPSYEFGDGSDGTSGILRRPTGEASFRVFSRSTADTPNRFTIEFQDALNEYQQDSYSLVDLDDVARCGQEISTTLSAIGVANYDQAGRLLKVNLDKSVYGNSYIQFETSVKAFGVRAGDVIAVTYLKEGWIRQPFRIVKLTPGMNHRITRITAQIHNDMWYSDANGQGGSTPVGRRQGGSGIGVPKPLLGSYLDHNGDVQFGVTESVSVNSDDSAETTVSVSFVAPAPSQSAGPGIPMLSLAPTLGSAGSLRAGQTLYYAISAVDDAGAEGALSFIVGASIERDDSSVKLSDLSFAPGTVSFNVYRGNSPTQLYRIASDQPPAPEFIDSGLPKQLIAVPDQNYDHANFYRRMELLPETQVVQHSANTLGNPTLQMAENRYRGMVTRITRGKGSGQERTILANSSAELVLSAPWDVVPDETSFFVVAENGWQFAALAQASPVQFAVPNRAGETVQILGRAANVNNIECAAELSIVTRWRINGSTGGGITDTAVPPGPSFGLGPAPQRGSLFLSALSFPDTTNTRTITSATLTLNYWDELQGQPATALASAIGESDQLLTVSGTGTVEPGCLLQLGQEVLQVEEIIGATTYRVTRGIHGTTPAGYPEGTLIYTLARKTVIAPFPLDFFASPYSGSWTFPIHMPDIRVATAELFVTNERGNSPITSSYLTHNDDNGLRTLSGGQYSLQVDGFLAVEDSVGPALAIEATHAVRDIYAILGSAADSAVQLRLNLNDRDYCTLTIAPGTLVSNSVSGLTLPPLTAGATVTLSVLATGQVRPGSDLTVLVRL